MGISDMMEPVIRNAVFGEDNQFQPFSSDKLYSYMLGALTAGVYNLYYDNLIGQSGGTPAETTGDSITADPYQLTPTHSKTLSNKQFSALVDDIKVNGIQEPIKYVKYNGEMYVVDGHHRLLAAKKLGITVVPVKEITLPYKSYKTYEDLFWDN
jgi:hypothetical protein